MGTQTDRVSRTQKRAQEGKESGLPHPGLIVEQAGLEQVALQRVVADPAGASPGDVMALQAAYGNRAVSGLFRSPRVQAKLVVGPVGDRYEQEADRVADQVMSTAEPAPPSARGGSQPVQRQEEEELQMQLAVTSITPLAQRQEEEELQAQPLIQRQEEEELQAQPLLQRAAGGFDAGPDIEQRLEARKGGGAALPGDVRDFMEGRFGADFGDVRLHTGGEAAQLSRQLSAQAFTRGQDIYMGTGRYNPTSSAGKRLLAHELTHVVQQGGAHALRNSPLPAIQKASDDTIQRTLDFGGTNWKETQEISWVKGQGMGVADNVLLFKGGGNAKLWVKTNEDPSETMAAATLVASATQAQQARMAGHAGVGAVAGHRRGWAISTPEVREATAADKVGIAGKLSKIRPKVSWGERRALKKTINATPVVIQTHAGGEMGESETVQETWISNPAYRKALGYTGVLDVILGNFDRTVGMLAPQNWKADLPNATVHLIDNINRGAFEVSLEDWMRNPWVAVVKARNWVGLKQRLDGYWAAASEWQAVPAAQRQTWLDGFIVGMQEALEDLPAVEQALAASGNVSHPLMMIFRRIRYLTGAPMLGTTRL